MVAFAKAPPISRRWSVIALAVAAALGVLLFGLIAATGDLLLVTLAVGIVGAIYLAGHPRVAIWIVIVLGLGGGALVSLAGPSFSKLPWGISILCFLLWIPVALAFFQRQELPAFIKLLLAFLVLALLSSITQAGSIGEFLAGLKRYFQAYGLLMALAVLPFTERDFSRWRILLAVLALAQLPFALYERFVLVPLRGGMERGAEVTDVVAGTFGANLEGGSPNSVMVLFLLLAVGFFYVRWREGVMSGRTVLLFALPCLAPIFLGETKIVLVLIPLILIALHRRELLKRPGLFVLMIMLGSALTTLIAYFYAELLWQKPLADVLHETIAYNFEHKGHGHAYLNRTTTMLFWWNNQGMDDPVGFLFGHGIGSSYTGLLSFAVGDIAARYAGYGIDLTATSLLLWEVGVAGFLLHLAVFATAFVAAARLESRTKDAVIRADARSLQAATASILLFHFYTNSVVAILSAEILVALILGYLAHLIRKGA